MPDPVVKEILEGAGTPALPYTPLLHRIPFLRPHDYAKTGRKLFRCSCGALRWSDAPRDIMLYHEGHEGKLAQGGTWWELFKVKVGILNWAERTKRKIGL